MLYTLNQTLGTKSLNLALILENEDGTFNTFTDFIYNDKAQALVGEANQMGLEVINTNDIELVVPVVYSANGTQNFTGLLNKLINYFNANLNDEQIAKVCTAIVKVIPTFTIDTFKAIKKSLAQLNEYVKTGPTQTIKYDSSNLIDPVNTVRVIEKYNINFDPLSYIREKSNHTLFMNECTDEVFIKLADYASLMYGTALDDIVLTDFFKPYPRVEYYRYGFMEFFNHYNDIDIKAIVGNADNNDLPIQDNEQHFYNCMRELIDFVNTQQYENLTAEECAAENICASVVKNYLLDLAVKVASWNWGHTGFYSIGRSEGQLDIDDDEPEYVDSDSKQPESGIEGNYEYQTLDAGTKFVDAESVLRDYISSVAKEDIYTLAEAVVKLCRWGKRKPSKLKLEKSDYYLDLNTYRIDRISGSIKDMEVQKVNGATLSFEYFITYQQKLIDGEYCRERGANMSALRVPIGAVCFKRFTTGVIQRLVMSIPTLLSYVEQNPDDVDGLKKSGDKIITTYNYENVEELSLDVVLEQISSGSVDYMEFYNDDSIVDLFMEFNAYSTRVSELASNFFKLQDIVDEIETYSFTSKDELIDKVCRNRNLSSTLKGKLKTSTNSMLSPTELAPYLNATISKRFFNIVFDVNKVFMDAYKVGEDLSIDQVLALYQDMMIKYKYSSPYLNEEGTVSATKASVVNDLVKMTSFNNSSPSAESEESSDEEEAKMLSEKLIMKPTGATRCAEVIATNAEGTALIGYVYVMQNAGTTKYLLSTKAPNEFEGCEQLIVKGKMDYGQLIKTALKDYFLTLDGHVEKSRLRFTDKESWSKIASDVSKYFK